MLEKSPSETLETLNKAYGTNSMKKKAVYELQKCSYEGRTNIERPGDNSLLPQMKILEVFFDSVGIIHYKFIPEGQTVNKEL